MYIVHSIGSLRGQATSALLTQWYRERYTTSHNITAQRMRCFAAPRLQPARQTTRLNVSYSHATTNTTTSQHLYPSPIVLSLHCRVSGTPHTLSLSWFHLPLRSSAWQKVNLWRWRWRKIAAEQSRASSFLFRQCLAEAILDIGT
jgi:hypothetical protein